MRIRIRLVSALAMLIALLVGGAAAAPAQAQTPIPTIPVVTPGPPGPTSAPSPTLTTAPPPAPVLGCAADVQVTNDWGTGFVAELVVTNTGTVPVTWEATVTFGSATSITQGWNGVFTFNGNEVVVGPPSWQSVLPPGASGVAAGLVGTGPAAPTGIGINCLQA